MKKFTTLLSLVLFFTTTVIAGPVDLEKALETASSFWNNNSLGGKKNVTLQLSTENIMSKSGSRLTMNENDAQYYLFTPEDDNGFIIVSGEDKLSPIVGYSTGNTNGEMPPALVAWLEEYSTFVDDVRSGEIELPQTKAATGPRIEPMLKTSWNQSTPYNNLCPTVNGNRTPTGCTATAMAQIMKFHEWPAKPLKAISWNNNITGKTETIDITKNTYDWANMLNHYRSGYNSVQANAVARLMIDVGKAINSSYALEGTGSSYVQASNALVNVFDYSPELYSAKRTEYTNEEYYAIIRENLEARQPLLYCGHGQSFNSGHAFVCDGIDENNLLHIDWGWDGAYNGYFDIGSMAPGGSGIGGGEARYNVGQVIVANIRPRTTEESNRVGDPTLYIYDVVRPSTNTVVDEYKSKFSAGKVNLKVVAQILNWSHSTTKGLYGLRISKEDGTIVRHISIGSLPAIEFEKGIGYYIPFEVNNSNTANSNYLAAGKYYVQIYYVNNDNEKVLMRGEGNSITLEVSATEAKIYKTLPEIEVTDLKFIDKPVFQLESASFDVAFRNNNAVNASALIVPIANLVKEDGTIESDTLDVNAVLVEVLDDVNILVTYETRSTFNNAGNYYFSFAYNMRNYYTDHGLTADKKTMKSIAGKSEIFEIKSLPEGPRPIVTDITQVNIVAGKRMNISATVKNCAYTESPYTATLGLIAEKDGKSVLLAQRRVENLARNATTKLTFNSEDYFPAFNVGTYETYVCELDREEWKKIAQTESSKIVITKPTVAMIYLNDKATVNDNNIALKGDSADLKASLCSMYGDFDGYIRVNVLNGITMVLRSDFIPVTLTEGESFETTIKCMCGTSAPVGDWLLSIAYYDGNKRQLGHVSNNSITFPDNGMFKVADATAVEDVAENNIAVTAYNGSIKVEGIAENATIKVSGFDGRTVYRGTATNIAVERGIYIVTVEQGGKTKAAKVLVK